MNRKILIVGDFSDGALEVSYARAFEGLGLVVERFEINHVVAGHTKFGRFGKLVNAFVPVEPWINKANRSLVVVAKKSSPDVILVFGVSNVRAGALAQIRATNPKIKLALYWPDPLLRLFPHVLHSIPVYNIVATYSKATCKEFGVLGAKRVIYLPFAADLTLHNSTLRGPRDGPDVCFIGNHRPERESLILRFLEAGLSVDVWGQRDWIRHSKYRDKVRLYWKGNVAYGEAFARLSNRAKVAINLIDPTNYPAANMRLFELAACGAVSLNSSCPEAESDFLEGVHTFYFNDEDEAVKKAKMLISAREIAEKVSSCGEALVKEKHQYLNRAEIFFNEAVRGIV